MTSPLAGESLPSGPEAEGTEAAMGEGEATRLSGPAAPPRLSRIGHEEALPRVTRLVLENFRSYPALDLPARERIVALVGENGAGKTNVLEALSLFAPGRGLRRADLAEMARSGGPGSFAASITIDAGFGEHRLGAGLERTADGRLARLCRIDGAPAGSPSAFAEFVRIVWLTPDLDALFRGPAGDRRRFLDRLVLAVDAEHAARVAALERSLRSRNRVLEEDAGNRPWLDAIERELAELAVVVASARHEAVQRLAALVKARRDDASPFPWATLSITGEIDDLVATWPAVDAEDRYRGILRDGRSRDRAAGRTLVGPQASDLAVRHGPKDVPAATASTGEQKALLVGLVLAHAHLVEAMSGTPPILLLDEITAHLDRRRREGLFDALSALRGQVWMTGADPALFAELAAEAEILSVSPGRVEPAKF